RRRPLAGRGLRAAGGAAALGAAGDGGPGRSRGRDRGPGRGGLPVRGGDCPKARIAQMSEKPVRDTPLLLVAPGQGDSDWLYATGFDVESALFVDFGADQVLVVPELEFERAKAEARVGKVVERGQDG